MFDPKKKDKLSPVEMDAKASVLQELRKMAEEMMGGKLDGLKKVTVASDDPKGLELGLDKAKSMIAGHEGEGMEGESAGGDLSDENSEYHEDEGEEAPEEEHAPSEMDHMSEEEIDQKLQELMALKDKMKAKV